MSGVLLSHETVDGALRMITALADETVLGSVGAGITLVDSRGRKTSRASSGPLVEEADRLQYELDEGPCLTAWATRTLVRIDDTATELRWYEWCQRVLASGLRSTLSAPLLAGDEALGAIKLYAREPAAFHPRDEHLLVLFAAQAAVLVANLQAHAAAVRLSEDLKTALRSRDLIGQAKGILIANRGVDEDEAFRLLAAASQRQNVKLVEVARSIVESARSGRP
jgi:GAF domain-containing protein